ncbi:hypothetical protein T12_16678 [Trichinella patagoniensis]|uniref:Uncharacterized protein n=1 Tax=Trichinella patagoniensis TaxID=990121 RepID=A0A0V0ZJ43_9BILA|nr:hypothetical protein T12_16678 [Trichinella patagoniensis]
MKVWANIVQQFCNNKPLNLAHSLSQYIGKLHIFWGKSREQCKWEPPGLTFKMITDYAMQNSIRNYPTVVEEMGSKFLYCLS